MSLLEPLSIVDSDSPKLARNGVAIIANSERHGATPFRTKTRKNIHNTRVISL
jgi:hypothetical protein